jgi:proline dehydrogenase
MASEQVQIDAPARTRRLQRRRRFAYGAGPGLDDALGVARRLADDGLRSTIGFSPPPLLPPRAVADVHLRAFDRLAAEGGELDCYVSVKLAALGFEAALFAELEAAAARSRRRLHVDALAPEAAEATWGLLEGPPRAGRVGTTLPGRWHRSPDDVDRAARLDLAVRVVKGQWADTEAGAQRVDAGFLRVVERLRGHARCVGVATHDVRLLAQSLRRLTAAGTPCEVELFYGMPFRAPAACARRAGVPVRVYVPYGDTGAPYGRADLVRHPAATWWLMQDLLWGQDKTWRAIRRSRPRR